MSDRASQEVAAAASARATELVADFRARHEEWRRQAQGLARLREDARAAAERDAIAILEAARADIRRILIDARRGLLVLATQLQAIGNPSEFGLEPQTSLGTASSAAGTSVAEEGDLSASVLQARRDLQRLLAEMRPDLEELAAQVHPFAGPSGVGETTTHAPAVPNGSDAERDRGAASAMAAESDEGRTASDDPHTAVVPQSARDQQGIVHRHGKGVLTAFALIAGGVVAGTAWWLTGVVGATDDLRAAAALIPRAPIVTPSYEPKIPTLTASLIVMPPAIAAGQPSATAPSAVAGSGPLSLDIEARRSVWIRCSIDGGAATARTFKAGETSRMRGARSISILVGDAGAVAVSFNGGQRTVLGRDGQVLTRQFTVDDATGTVSSRTPRVVPGSAASTGGPIDDGT